MKKLIVIACILLISATTWAQKTEGHVKYKVELSTDNPDNQMAVDMMQGMTMEIFFKDEFVRSDIKMGAMLTMNVIANSEDGNTVMLMSGMIGKMAIKTTEEELDDKNSDIPKLDLQLINETKEISGYTCKKAIAADESGSETVYWYTEDIKIKVSGNQFMNNEIPGFPMEMSLDKNDMQMVFTVESFEKKVKNADEIFDMAIPEGYDEMSLDDLTKMGM